MLKKFIPMALAATMIGLVGCAQPGERVEGGGAGEGRTPAEQAAAQESVAWGTSLTGDKRTLAEAATRVSWMQANIAANEWEQAGEDLADIEDKIVRLSDDPDVPAAVKQELATFQPMIDKAGQQLVAHDAAAHQTAMQLSDKFGSLMSHTQVAAWFSEGQGGGAGVGEPGVRTDVEDPTGTREHNEGTPGMMD